MNFKKVILSAVSTSWLYRGITALNGLISLPIIIGSLGKTEYGIWIVIWQSVNIFALADFGIGSAVGRFVAHYRGKDDHKSLDKLLTTSLLLLTGGAVIVILLTLLSAPIIPSILKIQPPYQDKAVFVFLILGFSLAIQFPFHIGMGFLIGHQYYGPHAVGKIVTALLNLFGILLLFAFHNVHLTSLALINSSSAIIGQIILTIVAWKLTGPWKIQLSFFTKTITRDLMGLGSSSLIITCSNMAYRFGLSLVLARMLSMEAVAIYGVALTIIENIQPLITSLSIPFSTMASELHARDRIKHLRNSINVVIRVTFSAALSIVIAIYFFAEPILRFLLHKTTWTQLDYIHAKECLLIMGIGSAIGLPQITSKSTLQGVGKHWYISFSMVAFSACAVLSTIISIHLGAGLVGAAIGWSTQWILQGTTIFPLLISRFLKQPLLTMIRSCYVSGLLLGSLLFVIFYGIVFFIPPSSQFNLIISLIICSVLLGLGIIISSGYFIRIIRYSKNYFENLFV